MTPKPLPTGELRKLLAATIIDNVAASGDAYECGAENYRAHAAVVAAKDAFYEHAEALLDAAEERDELKSSLSEMRKENERWKAVAVEAATLLREVVDSAYAWEQEGCTCSYDESGTCPVRYHGYKQEDTKKFLGREDVKALAPQPSSKEE